MTNGALLGKIHSDRNSKSLDSSMQVKMEQVLEYEDYADCTKAAKKRCQKCRKV